MNVSDCDSGLFSISESGKGVFTTYCPNDYSEWYLLMAACTLCTVFLGLSIFSLIILNYFKNPVNKMKTIKTLCCGMVIWPEKDKILLPFVDEILANIDFEDVDKKAKTETGNSLLELSILHGYSNLAIVS